MKRKRIVGVILMGGLGFFVFKGIHRILNPGHLIISLEAINSGLPTENRIRQRKGGFCFNSFVFDGQKFIHHPLKIPSPPQLSICVWLKPAPWKSEMPDTVVIRKGEYEFAITRDEREPSRFWAYANGVASNVGSSDLKIGVWNHVVLSYDGKQILLFVNRKEAIRRDYVAPISDVNPDLIIGGDGRQNFHGEMGRLNVFNRALTKKQVCNLFILEKILMLPLWLIILFCCTVLFLFWLPPKSTIGGLCFVSGLFYLANVWLSFKTLVAPSDPLQYVGSAVWKTTYGYWPWLDRIVLANNLNVFCQIFPSLYAGPIYISLVNVSLLCLSMWWAYRTAGLWASVFSAVLFNASYLTLGWSTYVYPDQTVALFALASFVCLSASLEGNEGILVPLAGFFSAWATLSKATGIASLLFSVGFLIFNKRQRWVIRYIVGGVAGALSAVGLFVLFYNWESMCNVWYLFFKSSINDNLKTIGKPVNNYFDLIVNSKYYPMVALIALTGAYRDRHSKYLFMICWVYLIFLCVIRLGGPPIPNYFYPSFIFCLLGTSIYFGQRAEANFSHLKIYRSIPFVCMIAGFVVIVFGISYSHRYPAVSSFSYSYNYFLIQDVYSEGLPYTLMTKLLYSWGPAVLLIYFLLFEILSSTYILAIGFCFILFFMAFFGGGLAYKKSVFDRKEARPYYSLVSVFNRVPEKEFGVFIENTHGMRMDRVTWVYRVFFDGKFDRKKTFDSQIENEKEINAAVKILSTGEVALNYTGSYILTDRPDVFLNQPMRYTSIAAYPWEDGMLTLIEKKGGSGD